MSSSHTTRRVGADSAGKRASHHLALHHDVVRQTNVVEAPAVSCNELRAGQQIIIVMLVLVRSSLRYWSAKKGFVRLRLD
jgi:isoprenylcysteine carboxyl methyltransferase (ICMT) family protein YpbQ